MAWRFDRTRLPSSPLILFVPWCLSGSASAFQFTTGLSFGFFPRQCHSLNVFVLGWFILSFICCEKYRIVYPHRLRSLVLASAPWMMRESWNEHSFCLSSKYTACSSSTSMISDPNVSVSRSTGWYSWPSVLWLPGITRIHPFPRSDASIASQRVTIPVNASNRPCQ